jgi:hypothetical protein
MLSTYFRFRSIAATALFAADSPRLRLTHNVTSRTSIAALRKVHPINALLAARRAYSGVLIFRFHTLMVVSGGMRFPLWPRRHVLNNVAESKQKS